MSRLSWRRLVQTLCFIAGMTVMLSAVSCVQWAIPEVKFTWELPFSMAGGLVIAVLFWVKDTFTDATKEQSLVDYALRAQGMLDAFQRQGAGLSAQQSVMLERVISKLVADAKDGSHSKHLAFGKELEQWLKQYSKIKSPLELESAFGAYNKLVHVYLGICY